MIMTTLRIRDFLSNNLAVSAVDGDKVFEKIKESFERDEEVTLDFEGITLVITAFLNSAIGKLYGSYDEDKVRQLLDIQNLDQEELLLLKLVIDRAKLRFSDDESE